MGDNQAIIGTGILLQAGDGATPVEHFTSTAELVSLKPNQLSRNEVDVSVHNRAREQKILGMLRSGQVTGTLNWLPRDPTQNSHTGMLADLIANTWRNYRILVPPAEDNPADQVTCEFYGAVQLFDPQEVAMDSPLQVAFALTIDLSTFVVVGDEEET
jgi:hypothetical protein